VFLQRTGVNTGGVHGKVESVECDPCSLLILYQEHFLESMSNLLNYYKRAKISPNMHIYCN
jgi:hypothetical protein